jgi:hypothetical protein
MIRNNSVIDPWVSTNPNQLPDFIIGGAMKCGTTSLHQILNSHPKVFIPEDEINFFDIDNLLQHSDFNHFSNDGKWVAQFLEKDPIKFWNWYLDKFKGNETKIIGEDSTTYLASNLAADRISKQEKPIKLIFVLRQPSERAYSNYLHRLKAGRALYSFEDTLRFEPFSVLNRSLYLNQLKMYYEKIPENRIKIILFEDLITDRENTLEDISAFIGVDYAEFPRQSLGTHANKSILPSNIKLNLLKNQLTLNSTYQKYSESLPLTFRDKKVNQNVSRLINKIHRKINTAHQIKQKMNADTKLMLDTYFRYQLLGLDELIDRDLDKLWFKDI